jgi:hypothetical protein
MGNFRAPRRDAEVDAVCTIYWFYWLGIRLGTLAPREIQRAIAPETLGLDKDGEPIRNNKFLGYQRGEHVPQARLVQHAEEIIPWSGRALNHPLWKVLRSKGHIRKSALQWVHQLDREVQAVVLGHFNQIVGGASRHTLGALERRASLDSLAALTILLRLRHEENESEWVWLYACSIFRVLLMVGPHLEDYGVADRVFQLFVQRVFSLAVLEKKRMDPASYQYVEFSHLLAELVDRMRSDDAKSTSRRMPTFYAIKILDGHYRQALKEFFEIPIVSTDE